MRIYFGNRKLTHFIQSYREVDFDSSNVVLAESAQVVTPTVARAPVMPSVVRISVSPGKKREKFNEFKRWS